MPCGGRGGDGPRCPLSPDLPECGPRGPPRLPGQEGRLFRDETAHRRGVGGQGARPRPRSSKSPRNCQALGPKSAGSPRGQSELPEVGALLVATVLSQLLPLEGARRHPQTQALTPAMSLSSTSPSPRSPERRVRGRTPEGTGTSRDAEGTWPQGVGTDTRPNGLHSSVTGSCRLSPSLKHLPVPGRAGAGLRGQHGAARPGASGRAGWAPAPGGHFPSPLGPALGRARKPRGGSAPGGHSLGPEVPRGGRGSGRFGDTDVLDSRSGYTPISPSSVESVKSKMRLLHLAPRTPALGCLLRVRLAEPPS